MEDFNLLEEDAVIIKHLLVNICTAACHRLDAISDQLESICANTAYLDDKFDQLLSQPLASKEYQCTPLNGCSTIDGLMLSRPENVTKLNCEEDFPDGSWLGFEANSSKRVRVNISPSDLSHIDANCHTPVKMALTLLDFLFDRDTQACSNLSGTGKYGKHPLDPVLIYGIRCHLERKFLITESEWRQIKLNIDSKCRTAHRRKMLGLPLTVKRFGGLAETSDFSATDLVEYSSQQSAAQKPLVVVNAASDVSDDNVPIFFLTPAELASLHERNGLLEYNGQLLKVESAVEVDDLGESLAVPVKAADLHNSSC